MKPNVLDDYIVNQLMTVATVLQQELTLNDAALRDMKDQRRQDLIDIKLKLEQIAFTHCNP